MEDLEEPREAFGAKVVRDWRAARLTEARREYADIMNRLWAGNGAGAVVSISLVAEAAHYGRLAPFWWLASPTAFIVGLLMLCVGSIIRLWDLRRIVQDLEQAEGVLDVHVGTIRWPSHDAGLHGRDARTVCGGLAALMFVVGTVIGLVAIYEVSFSPR